MSRDPFTRFLMIITFIFVIVMTIIIFSVARQTSTQPITQPPLTQTPAMVTEYDTIYWNRMGFYWARSHSPRSNNYHYFRSGKEASEFAQANYPGDSEVFFQCEDLVKTLISTKVLFQITSLIESCDSGYLSIRTR